MNPQKRHLDAAKRWAEELRGSGSITPIQAYAQACADAELLLLEELADGLDAYAKQENDIGANLPPGDEGLYHSAKGDCATHLAVLYRKRATTPTEEPTDG